MVTKVLEIKSVGILFVIDIRHKVIKFVDEFRQRSTPSPTPQCLSGWFKESHIQIFSHQSLSLVRDEQPPWDKRNMKNDTEGSICSFSTLDEASYMTSLNCFRACILRKTFGLLGT